VLKRRYVIPLAYDARRYVDSVFITNAQVQRVQSTHWLSVLGSSLHTDPNRAMRVIAIVAVSEVTEYFFQGLIEKAETGTLDDIVTAQSK